MSELVVVPQIDMDALERSAEHLVQSKYSTERNVADALWLIATGAGLGIDPATALRAIHVIKGKPVLSADLMSAVAMRHPACEYLIVRKMTAEECVIATKRRGWPEEVVMSWTSEDAKRAGLSGDNWRKYPQAMLKARCLAQIVRASYPDALMGCYVEGELDEAPEPQRATVEALDSNPTGSALHTARLLDVTPYAAPPVTHPVKLTAGEEHDALCNQLRAWCVEAGLKGADAGDVAAGFVARYGGDGAEKLGQVPLAALRTGIEDVRVRIARWGLSAALRDTAQHAKAGEEVAT